MMSSNQQILLPRISSHAQNKSRCFALLSQKGDCLLKTFSKRITRQLTNKNVNRQHQFYYIQSIQYFFNILDNPQAVTVVQELQAVSWTPSTVVGTVSSVKLQISVKHKFYTRHLLLTTRLISLSVKI